MSAVPQLSQDDFRRLAELVRERTGISLSGRKRGMMANRLTRRLHALGLDDFAAYLELVAAKHSSELEHFTNAVTTNMTSFFRDGPQFEFLRDRIVPELVGQLANSEPLRIWSTACSTGEEPYSIVMACSETPLLARRGFRVLATDIDTAVLSRARDGVYRLEQVERLDADRLRRFFLAGAGSKAGMVRVRSELAEAITFRELNLMERWPRFAACDVIFCRNVAIYFDKDVQLRLFERLLERLKPGGYLLVGYTEVLPRLGRAVQAKARGIFQKPR